MSIFQKKKIQELLPVRLNIENEETESLKLKSSSFNEILPYQNPNKSPFQRVQVVKIFVDHLTFALLLYLISGLLSGLLGKLCLKMSTGELNNDFHQEQIQAPPKLVEKDTRLLASTDEDKFSTTNNSGEII